MLLIREAIKVKHIQGEGVEVTASLSKIAAGGSNTVDAAPDEKHKRDLKKTVASIQGRGIDINKKFSIHDVISEYVEK